LASLLPMVVLALLASAALLGDVGTRVVRGIEMQRAPLVTAVDSFAGRRVRNALMTHRFTYGEWPRNLAELRERGLLDNRALAFAEGRPYYYVKREEGVVLLAPER
jgi:hypothetical protein